MKKDLFIKLFKTLLTLSLAFGMAILVPLADAEAATKPAKPVISVKSDKDGTAVKVTISSTKNAEGYLIYMKSDTDTKYKKVKTLKKDGTVARSYTVKKLSAGTYSFKVKAYLKSGEKTIKGSYSKVKTVTLETAADKGDTKSTSDFSKAKTGDYITFGSYEQDNNPKNGKEPIEWLVLSNNGKELYVVSKYALDNKKYNEEKTDATWEICSLRKWLNDDFYMAAFSKSERSAIKTTTVKNDDNPEYGTEGGNDTKDKVFLLSLSDINNPSYGFDSNYSTYDINRGCAPTAYAMAQGAWVYTGTDATYQTKSGEGTCDWWLRSPGDIARRAAYVGYYDYVIVCGDYVYNGLVGVRPALYINLNP